MAKPKKNTKKEKDTMTKREKRTVPVKLTDKELRKISADHVDTLDKIAAKEEEKKTADAVIKKDIALLDECSRKMASMIRSGTEERELEVDVMYDWPAKEVRVVRVDTKEEIAKRTMTSEEAQREMFGVDHKKDRGEVKDAKGDAAQSERKLPLPNDVIDVETLTGWKRGKVLPSSGSLLDVECSDGKTEHVPVESSLWRWPDEVGEESSPVVDAEAKPLTATVEEQTKAKGAKKSRKKIVTVLDENGEPLAF